MSCAFTSWINQDKFVLHIPDELDLAEAAPLLCAGVTTFSPLKRFGVGEGTKLAIIGLGGLGHIAVQFAQALGATVTVPCQPVAGGTEVQ